MSFNFGGASTPAPTGGAFSFGSTAPTPAPSGSFNFGGTPSAATPAPSTGFGGFGGTPAPGPAPSTGFSFGGAPAPGPAPSTAFSFGGTPAPGPTPSTGFGGFGGTPAPGPAPSTGFSFANSGFGSSTPAPSGFGGFGSPSPAPSAFGAFGSSASNFGAAPATNALQAGQTPAISGNTRYEELPQEFRQAIDSIHEAMMRHKRVMINLQSMGPRSLVPHDPSKTNPPAPGQPAPLAVTIRQLNQSIAKLEQETGLEKAAESLRDDYETLLGQAFAYGKCQIDALALRKGVHLRPTPTDKNQQNKDGKENKEQSSAQAQLQAVLDRQMAYVDRLERMPSPYLWQILEDLQKRLHNLGHYANTVRRQIHSSARSEEPEDISANLQSQHRAIHKIAAQMDYLHSQVEQLRRQYSLYERGENVLDKARYEEQQRVQRLNERIQMQYVRAASSSGQTAGSNASNPAPAPTGFAGTPAPSSFSFGGSSAPAPSTAFGTGSTPAPSSGFSFGPTPAPAPTSTFGTPAPSTGAFGAPAPAAGSAFSFSSSTSTSSTSKSKNKSRSKSRLGR